MEDAVNFATAACSSSVPQRFRSMSDIFGEVEVIGLEAESSNGSGLDRGELEIASGDESVRLRG